MTFTEALIRRGIRFRQSPGDKNKVHLNCLFCTSRGKPADTKYRLCVHVTQLWGRCMHCEWKHRYAIAPVLKQLGILVEVEGAAPDYETENELIELPSDFRILTNVHDDLDLAAKNYILKRGVTEDQIRENKIGVSYSGRWAYRILFPIRANGKLVGINAREFTGNGKPKYMLSRGNKFLYHFDPKYETSIMSEGVIKSLRIDRVTDFNSAALLGHDLTDKQFEQILDSACTHIILYPDPDKVGRQGVLKIADKLSEKWGGEVSIVWPVPGPADEVPLKELKVILEQNTVPYSRQLRRKILLRK